MRQDVKSVPASSTEFATVEEAVAEIAAGRPVVVVDDEDRENEGDIVFAAQFATPELVAFAMTHCRGLICVPMEGERLDALQLWPMTAENAEAMGTAFTVSTDARTGISSGISAADRARTISLLASPTTSADDLVRPGHIFPLRARSGGVLSRRGHTEAAVDLARLAGLEPAGVICEIANPDGSMARLPELVQFCRSHGVKLLTIADLAEHRLRVERRVAPVAEAQMPLSAGAFRALGYRGGPDSGEHLALVYGDLGDGADVLVSIHRECVAGDVFGSASCRCRARLDASLEAVAREGRGVVVYVRDPQAADAARLVGHVEGQHGQDDQALDEDANHLRQDAWAACDTGAKILTDLGISSVRLLDPSPPSSVVLRSHGLAIAD